MTPIWQTPNAPLLILSLGLSVGLLGCSIPSASTPASAELPASESVPPINEESSMETQQASSLAQNLPITAYTTINDTQINLEVARTLREQAIGLMFRPALPDDHGMLFPFSPPRPVNFWMRNVEINLDMIFIRDDQVLAIAAQVPPCRTDTCPTYGPRDVPVDAVLELRGGRAEELGIQVGDPIVVTFLDRAAEFSSEPPNSSQ